MKRLMQHLFAQGIESAHLNELVHDMASREAADINSGGLESQITYLLEAGWTPDTICDLLDVPRPESACRPKDPWFQEKDTFDRMILPPWIKGLKAGDSIKLLAIEEHGGLHYYRFQLEEKEA